MTRTELVEYFRKQAIIAKELAKKNAVKYERGYYEGREQAMKHAAEMAAIGMEKYND